MKSRKIPTILAISMAMGFIFTSCGMLKNNDFSSRKYTHFRKGESVVNIDQSKKEKKEVDPFSVVRGKKEIAETPKVNTDKHSQTITSKIESGKTANNIVTKEIINEKINRARINVINRIANRANTVSYDHHGDGTGLIWTIIIILIILWVIGYFSGGLGIGGLLDLLLLIALILFILWLLQII